MDFCYWPVRGRVCRTRPQWRLLFDAAGRRYCTRHKRDVSRMHPTWQFEQVSG